MRIAIPMRINESPRKSIYFFHFPFPKLQFPFHLTVYADYDETSLRRHASLLLHPAQTAYEQAERDRTWWYVETFPAFPTVVNELSSG